MRRVLSSVLARIMILASLEVCIALEHAVVLPWGLGLPALLIKVLGFTLSTPGCQQRWLVAGTSSVMWQHCHGLSCSCGGLYGCPATAGQYFEPQSVYSVWSGCRQSDYAQAGRLVLPVTELACCCMSCNPSDCSLDRVQELCEPVPVDAVASQQQSCPATSQGLCGASYVLVHKVLISCSQLSLRLHRHSRGMVGRIGCTHQL